MIQFRIKDINLLKKYGFINHNNTYVYYNDLRRMWVYAKDRFLHFNLTTKEELLIFYKMISNGEIEVVNEPDKRHYMKLTDEEYTLILKRREK